jgi:hypothetical protein
MVYLRCPVAGYPWQGDPGAALHGECTNRRRARRTVRLNYLQFHPAQAGPRRVGCRGPADHCRDCIPAHPTGKIVIKNLLGFKVGEVKLDEHFVIPGAIRKLHNSWPTGAKKPLLFGRYTAELDATYAGGKHLTAKTSFTVIPWRPTALALIVLLVLLVLLWRARKRLGRALRILAGRE